MVEKQINGYLYNHTKQKFLEIYTYNHLSHIKSAIEKLALKHGLKSQKRTKRQSERTNSLLHFLW